MKGGGDYTLLDGLNRCSKTFGHEELNRLFNDPYHLFEAPTRGTPHRPYKKCHPSGESNDREKCAKASATFVLSLAPLMCPKIGKRFV